MLIAVHAWSVDSMINRPSSDLLPINPSHHQVAGLCLRHGLRALDRQTIPALVMRCIRHLVNRHRRICNV